MIRVLIVDDYPIVRLGLKTLLSDFDEVEVVAEAADGEFAMALCQQFNPMAKGLTNHDVSDRLTISPSTVNNHVSGILNKVDTTSRTQTVALAVEYRLLD